MQKILLLISALVLAVSATFSTYANELSDTEKLEYIEAIEKGDIKIVKKYVEANPANVNFKSFSWSPLLIAADKGQLEVVKYLISKGAEADYVHPGVKENAFHFAVFGKHKDIATLLAKNGADVNKKLADGSTLLQRYQRKNDTEMVAFLKSLGAKDDGCDVEICNLTAIQENNDKQLKPSQTSDQAFKQSLNKMNAGQLFAKADELNSQGDKAKAREALRALVSRFPNHALAGPASQQLASMSSADANTPVSSSTTTSQVTEATNSEVTDATQDESVDGTFTSLKKAGKNKKRK